MTSQVPNSAEVRSQLDKILASRIFNAAGRARRFLEFVVNQTLEGKHDQIKEYLLGVEVFDRAESFDPKLDTIVRVEAEKLRKRLQEYYETDGLRDTILIEIPRGSYVPTFTPRDAQLPPIRAPRPRWQFAALAVVLLAAGLAFYAIRRKPAIPAPGIPSIAVLPFLNLSPDPDNAYFAEGLSEELTDAPYPHPRT